MSDVQATPASVAVPAATETVPTPIAETAPVTTATDSKVVEPVAAAPVETAPAAATTAEAAPVAAVAEESKATEPVNEGLLGYKAPGFLKQFTFAKKDFWFNDEPVAPENLHSYLRGEKAEVAHPVVAYASQTGKGLLFFGKKGDSDKTKPAGVIPLYDATELKKTGSNEFTFRLDNESHSFKSGTDAEAEGWYQSIEKSIEIGKAQKESVVASEGYKAELQKLGSPVTPAGGAVAAVTAAAAGTGAAAVATNHTGDTDAVEGTKRTSDETVAGKNQKSRSTSRGFLASLRRKIDANLDEHEDHQDKSDEAHADRKAAQLADRTNAEPEAAFDSSGVDASAERPKPAKRESAFARLTRRIDSNLDEHHDRQDLADADSAQRTADKAEDKRIRAEDEALRESPAGTPGLARPKASKRNSSFLSGLSSPFRSTPVKEKDAREAELKDVTEEPAVGSAVAPQLSGATAVAATEPAAAEASAPAETATNTRRTSVFGGLGRRASNMISRMSSSKDVHPGATETAATENALAPAVTENDLAAHEATEPITTTAATTEVKSAESEATTAEPKVVATPFGTAVNGNSTA